MSTLVDELDLAAKLYVATAIKLRREGHPVAAEASDLAADGLRKRVEHVKRLRDECQSMADAHLFYALTGDL